MLTRSQSFPARMPLPRAEKKVIFVEEPVYKLVIHEEPMLHVPVTKRVNKQLCFLVEKCEDREWWSIDEFLKYGLFTDETVCHWINYKNEVARVYPNVKRRCLLCNRFALKGKTICFADHTFDGVKAQDYVY